MPLEELKATQRSAINIAWKAWEEYLNKPNDNNLIAVLNLIVHVEYCGELISRLCDQAGDRLREVLQNHPDKLAGLTRILMEIALKELRS